MRRALPVSIAATAVAVLAGFLLSSGSGSGPVTPLAGGPAAAHSAEDASSSVVEDAEAALDAGAAADAGGDVETSSAPSTSTTAARTSATSSTSAPARKAPTARGSAAGGETTPAAATAEGDLADSVVADTAEAVGDGAAEVTSTGAPKLAAPKRAATTTTSTTSTTTAPVVTVPSSTLWFEDFNSLTGSGWADGSVHGGWQVEYNGYGNVGAATDGSGVLQTRPMASTSPGETHGAMVLSTQSFSGNLDVELRIRTVQQLRTGSAPNPWEVGWAVWNYGGSEHFYYLALKPNGWELGKSDNAKLDPDGPVCTWPSYVNCRYEGAQRYLATGSSPTFAVGSWHTARIVQVGSTITVYGDGRLLGTTVDADNPFSSGRIGLYTEDAHVHFDDLLVRRVV